MVRCLTRVCMQGRRKPLSVIHSHGRAGRRTSSMRPTFVRQERPNQGFSPPAASLRRDGGIQHVYSPAVLDAHRRLEQQPQPKRRFES